jgi:hypothetical protein
MAVTISPLARQQFSVGGVPLAGGLLFTYAAGTNTKLATYTDSSGGTPNANPVVLDSQGYCDLWLTAGSKYKLVLSPNNDTDPPTNPYWTRDNIVGSVDNSVLGGSGGSALVGDGSTNVGDRLSAINLADYTALRAYAGSNKSARVTGYLVSSAPSGIAGLFTVDDADTTSADNGGTIIVSANGKRWKRIFDGRVNVKWFGAIGDNDAAKATANTAAFAACIAFCQSDSPFGGYEMYVPTGQYKKNADLVPTKQYLSIRGDGMWLSNIISTTGGENGIKPAAMAYFRPHFNDFACIGDATTGKAIDFFNVSNEVYAGELKNLYLESGGDAFHSVNATGGNFFSMVVDNVFAYSYAGHCFLAACGPAVAWRNCYALNAGPGKAGYRLVGGIAMYSCNGLNSGDYWGVFGNDLASADGFQGDFPYTDLPDITMIGCNVEHFASLSVNGIGLRVQNAYQRFEFIGGKIDRNDLATAYRAMVYCRLGANGGRMPVRLDVGALYPGTGVPSLAQLYCESGAIFEDVRGVFIAGGITTFNVGGILYPLIVNSTVGDVFKDNAFRPNAISPRRLTVESIRYKELAITTVPATIDDPAIDVTGYTKLVMTPASAATYSRFSFTVVPGSGDDFGRNGDLIIEATNANVTLYHNYGAGNGMRLKSGANATLAQGEIRRFVRSANYRPGVSGWVEV